MVTERESWILDNKDRNPNISIEQNAHLVEPGLEFATEEFQKTVYKEVKDVLDAIYATHGKGAWKKKLMVNDRIADSIFQQVVTRADEYAVLATPNLNGDYISDACAAQIGGLGIAPGANIGDGYACFEATHGTAPKYADRDVINPTSVVLSGVMRSSNSKPCRTSCSAASRHVIPTFSSARRSPDGPPARARPLPGTPSSGSGWPSSTSTPRRSDARTCESSPSS